MTSHTKRYVKGFWALDVKRAQARFYPAIHPLQSYAEDAHTFAPWWTEQGLSQWLPLRRRFLTLLDTQAHLERMADFPCLEVAVVRVRSEKIEHHFYAHRERR